MGSNPMFSITGTEIGAVFNVARTSYVKSWHDGTCRCGVAGNMGAFQASVAGSKPVICSMWIVPTLIGIVLFVLVGILVGFGSFLPWVIIPIVIGSIFILPLLPASLHALKERTHEQEEFDDEHGHGIQ